VEASFKGVIDLVQEKAVLYGDELGADAVETEIPADLVEESARQRAILVERIAETDDRLTTLYLQGDHISQEDLIAGLRRATIAAHLVPVFCGTALRNKGIQRLLDAVVDYLPAPVDVPPVVGIDVETEQPVVCPVDDDAPFSALAFKIVSDPYVGRLTYFRVYSGHLETGGAVMNMTRERKERIGRLLQMHANHRADITEVYAGDIAAVLGLKNTFTGDTLCSPERLVRLESIKFPEPVIEVAIEPKTKADQDRMGIALQRLSEEDPTFRVRTDENTAQTLIRGMGELHLEVLVDRMLREYRVQANVGRPQVAYKETITASAIAEGRFIRQTGGHGQYGVVELIVEPLTGGEGFVFEDKTVGGSVPREYVPAVQAGVREALQNGVLAGYPIVDIKVKLVDGSYHEVDSSEMAFKIAGSMGVQAAVRKATPILLEPLMKVEVVTPDEFMGDVIGDLNARRGNIEGMESRGGTQVIQGTVPLATMFGYATDLRSKTQGRATYSMEFSRYAEVPKSMAEELTRKMRG
jgi:elongation factor G